MYKVLQNYIDQIIGEFDNIPENRKNVLREVSGFIRKKIEQDELVKLNFICTHNSRRSHLAQIWAATAVDYYGINEVETYSGGTEATAFNPNAVAAIERAGFTVKNPGGDNPKYKISFSEESEPLICFSKKFDDPTNPEKDFAAIMTCSDADKNCPLVPGTEFRKAVTYEDPKKADGTEQETQIYDERCRQIATEMFYTMSFV